VTATKNTYDSSDDADHAAVVGWKDGLTGELLSIMVK
jgi:hypothetical protein